MDIKKQLGTDFLKDRPRRSDADAFNELGQGGDEALERPRAPVRSSSNPSAASQDVIRSLSIPVLRAIAQNGERAGTYDLVDTLNMPLDALLKVVEYLVAQDQLAIAQRDLKGNHTVALTDLGRKLLQSVG